MLMKNKERWRPIIIGWGMFVFASIISLLLGPNILGPTIPSILGFLTAAFIIFIINIVYVLFTNKKSTKIEK